MIIEVRAAREWRHCCNHCGIFAPGEVKPDMWLIIHVIDCKRPPLPGGYELLPVWSGAFETTLRRITYFPQRL